MVGETMSCFHGSASTAGGAASQAGMGVHHAPSPPSPPTTSPPPGPPPLDPPEPPEPPASGLPPALVPPAGVPPFPPAPAMPPVPGLEVLASEPHAPRKGRSTRNEEKNSRFCMGGHARTAGRRWEARDRPPVTAR